MEKEIVLRVGAVTGFVAGLLLFAIQTRSTGEALETFKLFVEPGPLVMIGSGLMGVSLAVFALSFPKFRKKRGNE